MSCVYIYCIGILKLNDQTRGSFDLERRQNWKLTSRSSLMFVKFEYHKLKKSPDLFAFEKKLTEMGRREGCTRCLKVHPIKVELWVLTSRERQFLSNFLFGPAYEKSRNHVYLLVVIIKPNSG